MCGIVGFSGKTPLNQSVIAYLLYFNSQERGKHSTGFYTPETGIKKSADEAKDFLKKNKIPETKVFIGHVRHATVGAKTADNAHPFEFDNLVGVHNGTLENHLSMLRNRGVSNTGIDVDSKALYKLLDEDSKADEIIYTTLNQYDGAAALVFQDKRKPKVLYVYRNNDRPLFYGYLNKNMYMSSIQETLEVMGCTDVKQFTAHMLYSIEDGKILSEQFYKEYEKPTPPPRQSCMGNIGCNTNYAVGRNAIDGKEFVRNLRKSGDVNNSSLLGKWVMILHPVEHYGKFKTNISKNKWYYVHDYDVQNNYDIVIRNDELEIVTINKFMVDLNNYKLVDWGVIQYNKTYPESHPKCGAVLFSAGEVVEIIDTNVKLKDNKSGVEVFSEKEKKSYFLSITDVRPATDKEAADQAEKIKKQSLNQQLVVIEERPKDDEETNSPFKEPSVDSEEEQERKLAVQNFLRQENNDDEIDDDTPVDEKVERRIIEELVPATVFDFILDYLGDLVDDIAEDVSFTNWTELKKKMDELKDMIEESYDYEKVAEWKEELEEKEDDVQQRNNSDSEIMVD